MRHVRPSIFYSLHSAAWRQARVHTMHTVYMAAFRCDEEAVEEDIRKRSATGDAMGAKSLCIPREQPELPEGTKCFVTGKPAKNWCLFGRSY